MKAKKRQKMCYNCEGEIDLDVIVCPFCAADLREEKPEQQRSGIPTSAFVKNMSTQQSLYPPHYAPKAVEQEEVVPEPEQMAHTSFEEEEKSLIGPTLLLTLGSQLLLFGILMLFFSDKGVMVLKWDARLWFAYVFASIPLLIFGYRALTGPNK